MVWKMKINIKITNELKKLKRNRVRIYWSRIRNGLVSYDVVPFVFVLALIKIK
jgi:hypothetical protein